MKRATAQPSSSPPAEPFRSAPRPTRRQRARPHTRKRIAGYRPDIATDALTYVFDRNGYYEALADRLLQAQPAYTRWRGHWLCKQLDQAAQNLGPGTYAQQIGKSSRDGFLALGFPPFMADVLGAGTGVGLNITLGQTPMGQLVKSLRALGALVCPNISRCPAQNRVINCFASPVLAEQLKELEP